MPDSSPRTDIKDATTPRTMYFKVKAIILGMHFSFPRGDMTLETNSVA